MRAGAMLGGAAAAAMALCGAAQAAGGVSLNAARVGGEDPAALAQFYETAFGLKEVNRLEFPGSLEIMMNFGDTAEAAKANPAAQIVVMHRDSDDIADPVPHLVLNVADAKAAADAVTAAGGTVARAPAAFGDTGMMIGFVADPAGNQIEMIQAAKAR